MAKEVTRHINPTVARVLWAKAGGRCQFKGCNRLLYYSAVTLEAVNISEKAHIYSFSEDGPRGWSDFLRRKPDQLNNIDNLMLMCHDCHKTIDQDKDGVKYSADLLKGWKSEHERRVKIVTGIDPKNKTHVVFYGANIGDQKSPLQKDETYQAIFPHRYPAEETPVMLSMSGSHKDKDEHYWGTEQQHLQRIFQQRIEHRVEDNAPSHFTVFALAPMPLLIQLGALFTDKISVDVRQPIREPKTWEWQAEPELFHFIVTEPTTNHKNPVLIMSLTAKIDHSRVTAIMGEDIDIWEIATEAADQHNDFIRAANQLSLFRQEMRKLIGKISSHVGNSTPLHVFPAMPVSCSIEMGRIRMPKADMPWVIYDQNNTAGKFITSLVIQEQ